MVRRFLRSQLRPLLVLSVVVCSLSGAAFLHAQSISDIQNSIVESANQIDQLKKEISQLQTQLTQTSKQKQTLQNAVQELDLTIKKITKSIDLTSVQIKQKDAEIAKLSRGIATTSTEIGDARLEIGDSLYRLHMLDSTPLAVILLGGGTLSSVFDHAATLGTLRVALQQRIQTLGHLKTTLQTTKVGAQEKRQELGALKQNLAQQKQGLAIARQSQQELLLQTKNQESTYQTLIAQKKAQQARFEQDLRSFEAQLNLKVSASSLPPTGPGALVWPLDSIRITQYFGNTAFSTANPQVYNGKGHTGIDFAAAPGTPVKAARGGVVLGTGNTDATCPGASFGKWIFIKHDNGLSTLYAHLASFSVAKGESVTAGQLIGYSDTTGYATGPHLHFGVYASAGSEIRSFPSSSCKGKIYTMPVADSSAYLNPLSYLPTL